MPLDATLLELLACPSADHAPLDEQERDGRPVLVCSYCASSFPIEDGIPVLLLDEASPGPNGIGVAAAVAPVTVAPQTAAHKTVAPETVAPETVAHETVAPEAVAHETVSPETVAPTAVPTEAEPPEAVPPEAANAPTAPEPVMPTADPPTAKPQTAEPPTAELDPAPVIDSGVADAPAAQPEASGVEVEPEHDHLDLERPMVLPAVTASAPATDRSPSAAPTPQAVPRRPTPVPPALQQARTRANQLRRLVQGRVEEHIERGPDGRPRLKRRGPDS